MNIIGAPTTFADTGGGSRKLVAIARLPELPIRGVEFVSPKIGWLLGDRKLWKTTNGGDTWQLCKLPSNGLTFRIVQGLEFEQLPRYFGVSNTFDGWIQWGTDILNTKDGGSSWNIQGHLPIKDPTIWGFNSLTLLSGGQVGWAAGCKITDRERKPPFNDRPTIYRTTDGGSTWAVQAVPRSVDCQSMLVQALSADRAVLATSTVLCHTTNAGATWSLAKIIDKTSEQSAWVGTPTNIFFFDRQHGWAGYGEDRLLSTVDAGNTWQVLLRGGELWQAPSGVGGFGKVYFESTRVGWFLGGDGSIHESLDGGRTWRTIGSQEFLHEFACKRLNEADLSCWVVGETTLWRLE